MKKILLLSGCWILALSTLNAQIVNIEDSRKNIDSTGVFGHIDASFNLVQNAKRLLTFKASTRLDILQKKGAWLGIANYKAIQNKSTKLLNTGFFHIRYGYFLKERVTIEAFSQLQRNRQIKLAGRWLIGTGPRFLLLKKPTKTMYWGIAYMYEYDKILGEKTQFRDHRISSYLSLSFKILPQLQFSSTSYYQPLIRNMKNARLSSVNTLSFVLGQHFSFRTQFNISYDQQLANNTEGVPPTVYSFLNGIRWVF